MATSAWGTGDHVLDEVTVSWSIDDGEVELVGLNFHKAMSMVIPRSRSAFNLSKTSVFEKVTHFTGFLSNFDGTLVDTPALVDQVTGGGGLTGIYVPDNDQFTCSFALPMFMLLVVCS